MASSIIYSSKVEYTKRISNVSPNKSSTISLRDLAFILTTTNNLKASMISQVKIGFDEDSAILVYENGQGKNGCSVSKTGDTTIAFNNLSPISLTAPSSYGSTYMRLFFYNNAGTRITTKSLQQFIVPAKCNSITISGIPTKLYVNQTLDLSSAVIKGNFDNGQSTISSYKSSIANGTKFTTNDVGTRNITISYTDTYGTVSQTATIEIIGLSKIEVTNAPQEIKVGQLLSYPQGFKVTAYWSDGTSQDVTSSTAKSLDSLIGTVMREVKTINWTCSYTDTVHGTGTTKTLDLSTNVYGLSSLTSSVSSLSFKVGENFSFDGEITATFSNGTKQTISKQDCLWNGQAWLTFISRAFAEQDITTSKTITVSYSDVGIDKSFTLNVAIVGLSAISYTDSGTYFVGSSFPAAVQATALYTDGTSKTISASVTQAPSTTTSGIKDVIISYTEGGITKVKEFSINVQDIVVTSITSVAHGLNKTTYKTGETFDKSGLTLNVIYSNGSTGVVVPDETSLDNYEFKGEDVGYIDIYVNVGTLRNQHISTQAIVKKIVSITNTGSLGGSGTNNNEYLHGDVFNSSFIRVTKTYSDGTTEENQIPTAISPINGSRLTIGGSNTISISVTEGDVTVTTSATIYVKTISSLLVSGTLKTQFNYGDTFTLGTGVEIKAHYVGDHFDDEIVSDYDINIEIGTPLNYKSRREIRISKGGAVYSYNIDIVYLSAISVVSDAKTSFYEGEYFEFGDDASVTITYANTNGTTTTEEVSLHDLRISSTYNTTIRLTDIGTQNIPVKFTDESGQKIDTTYSIVVIADEVVSISLDTSAIDELEEEDKVGITKFFADYTMFYKSSLIIVTATYTSGKTSEINMNDCTASVQNGKTLSEVGTNEITITYKDKTATYEVEVVAHTVDHIEIDTDTNSVKKSFMIGDQFDATGLVVRAVYNSGYKKSIELGANGYSVSPAINYEFEDADEGLQEVTVSYGAFDETYEIDVTWPIVDHAVINTNSVNMQPRNHEVFYAENIVVTLVYTNGLEKTLTRKLSNVPETGKFYIDLTNLGIDGEGKINVDKLEAKTITITSWGYYSLVGASNTQTNTVSVAVLPDGALTSIYIDAAGAKTTYKTGEVFTGEGFVIMAKLVDYDDYVRVDVAGNSNVVTNPAKGSTIYKAGQIDVVFQYTLNNVVKEATFTISVIPSYSKTNATTETLKIVKMKTFDTTIISLTKSGLTSKEANELKANRDGHLWLLFNKNDTEIDNDIESLTYGRRIIKGSYTNVKCYGYVITGSRTADSDITVDNGKVILFEDYTPTIDGQSNITVKFRRTVKGNADKINLCRDILLYGYKTNRNRAFVSQNTKLGLENIDYHTEAINLATVENYEGLSDGDLTYFPDTGYTGIGQNSNKIIGEAILNNGYMIIIKSDSKQEPTIWFRHCEMAGVVKADGSTAYDATGNQLYEESYPVEPGNIGDGGISRFGLINFYGDTLFLTKKGLKGIDVGTSTSLTDDSKYATDRSTLVNRRLVKEDLANAHLFKFNDYLFIACGSNIYVANYNYRTGSQYEWWFLNNINANTFFEFDDELYFANKDGELCKFKEEDNHKDYTDKSRLYIGQGGLLPVALDDLNNANKIIFNYAKYKDSFANGDTLSILAGEANKSIYALIGRFVSEDTIANQGLDRADFEGIIERGLGYFRLDAGNEIQDNGYTKTQNLNRLLFNNRVVYLDQIQFVANASTNAVGVPYTLVTVDDDGNDLPPYCFRLRRLDGSYADLNNLEIVRVSFQIGDSSIITEKEVDDENETLSCKLIGDHGLLLDLIQYNNQATESFSAVVTKKTNVDAYWVTRPFNMNQPHNVKHIFYWVVLNDTELSSHTDLGYFINSDVSLKAILDRGESIVLKSQVGETEFDLTKMSLESWTFDVNGLPKTHKSDKTIEDIESISFVFRNFDDTNMVLSNLSVEYTVGNTI